MASRFIVTGPVTHTLYWILEAIDHRKTKTSTVKKVVIDRLVFAPPYLLSLLYFVARFEVNWLLPPLLILTIDDLYLFYHYSCRVKIIQRRGLL